MPDGFIETCWELRYLDNSENMVVFGDGDEVAVTTENESVRFLLISGEPSGEPVAWQGDMVRSGGGR